MQAPSEQPSRNRVRELINTGAYTDARQLQIGVCAGPHAGAEDWLLLARLHLRLDAVEDAIDALTRLDAMDPGRPDSANARAHALALQNRPGDAYEVLERQLESTPHDVESAVNLGYLAEQLGQNDDALARYTSALDRSPHSFRPRLNRAGLLSRVGRHAEALQDYEALVNAWPDRASGWYNRAECLVRLARHADAAASCAQALALEPGHVNAMMCRAVALASVGDTDAAQTQFDEAWTRDRGVAACYGNAQDPMTRVPDARAVYVYQAFGRLYQADWQEFAGFVATFERYADSSQGPPDDLSMAFPAMYAGLSPRSSARVHAAVSNAIARVAPPLPAPRAEARERLRLGYVSSKFRPGASMTITGELYAAHDRKRVEVFAYAVSADDGNPERAAVAAASDRFTDLSGLSDEAAAAQIRADGVDVLVDLNGYSNEARPGIAARRPAPLQIAYLGHMHSLHAPWIDYRVTDHIAEPENPDIVPPEARAFLPASFFLYDQRRRAVSFRTARGEAGLPEDAFVLCAFHAVAKIEPGVFAAWMTLLRRIEAGVLWLLDPGDVARANLLEAAGRAGIPPARIVFAPRLSHPDHVRRLAAADLYLDTFSHGAHGSALDVLHAGLPMLTRRGDALARRVGASLLTALDLPGLIASTTREYIDLAVRLAADPAALGAMRARLQRRIDEDSPFAAHCVVPRLERALETMWARHSDGLAPADFDVA